MAWHRQSSGERINEFEAPLKGATLCQYYHACNIKTLYHFS